MSRNVGGGREIGAVGLRLRRRQRERERPGDDAANARRGSGMDKSSEAIDALSR
jgi:hypothetical protein